MEKLGNYSSKISLETAKDQISARPTFREVLITEIINSTIGFLLLFKY